MLAEMGIALREDCSVMGVYTPRKVLLVDTYIV